MYIVVIGILTLVLTISQPVCVLATGWQQVLGLAAAATLLPPIAGWLVSRRVVRLLDRFPEDPTRAQAAFARGMNIVRAMLGIGHGVLLLGTDWLPRCAALPGVGGWPAGPGTAAMAPFLVSIVLVLIALYPADRAVRQIALEIYLQRGKPLPPVWNLAAYLDYNLRHQVLFLLIPMLLILAASDLVVQHDAAIVRLTGMRFAPDLIIGSIALFIAAIAPEILRHVWLTRRLPDGPLRDRLLSLARRMRLRFREILVWRSGGLIVNAAVMGVVAPLRYVLITDGMLAQMDDAKIEAVFGHEAGHVKRHHIAFFLIFGFISGCAVVIFTLRTHGLLATDRTTYQILATLFGVALALKWGGLFGWISRRFERQADIYGVRTLELSGLPCVQPCAVHNPEVANTPNIPNGASLSPDSTGPALATAVRPRVAHRHTGAATHSHTGALCSTAAHVFADALYEVALLNGIRPQARSWRHSSISSRSRFIQRLAHDQPALQRFEYAVGLTKLALGLTAGVGGVWAAQELGVLPMLLSLIPGA